MPASLHDVAYLSALLENARLALREYRRLTAKLDSGRYSRKWVMYWIRRLEKRESWSDAEIGLPDFVLDEARFQLEVNDGEAH